MRWLSDTTLRHLRRVAEWPDLDDTRYRILEPIGQGGMGTVFLAEDRELGRHVAFKVLTDPIVDAQNAQRMFTEARIIARLEHPGIIPVHDVGRLADGRIYYVMKFVRGKRLDAYFDEQSTIHDRLRVFERVCETAAFAHARGVIHRDLKPQNIMVGEFGEVLILDWGIAKFLRRDAAEDSGRTLTKSERADSYMEGQESHPSDAAAPPATAYGTVIGTPAYMPPEQARGEIDRVDERSDVYALGAILYFLLVGTPPPGAIETKSADAPLNPVQPPHPRRLNASVPRALDALCLKALAPEAEARYPSAAELAADVSRLLNGHAVSAYREGLIERLGRLAWTYRTTIVLVAAYLVMRAVLLFWSGR